MPLVSFYNPQEYLETSGIKWVNNYRSSHLQLFFKIGVIKNFAIFTGKHVLKSLFNKLRACNCQACNFIKKRIKRRCFSVNLAKFFRAAFFVEHLWWLLVN